MATLLARARRQEMTVMVKTSSGAWGPSAAHNIAVRVTAADAAAGVAVCVEREPPLLPGAETGYLAR